MPCCPPGRHNTLNDQIVKKPGFAPPVPQFAPCTPHGLERLAAAPSLQRLDVHCCDLVPDSGEQLQHLAQALQGLREFKIAWVRPDAVGGQGRSVQVVGECVLGGYAIAGGGYLRMFWRRGEKRVR